MKILIAAPTYLPARRANTIQVLKMAQGLADAGHAVHVIVPGNRPEDFHWDDLAHQYGLHVQFPVEWLPARPGLRRYDYAWSAVQKKRAVQADLIYTRLPQAAALASLLGVPVMYEVHDMPGGGAANLMQVFLNGPGRRRMVVITQALQRALQERFGMARLAGLSLVAADGVDLERYAGLPGSPLLARQELADQIAGMAVDRFTAAYTGHLYAGRGIEIIAGMAAVLPEVQFLVVGGDPSDVAAWKQRAAGEGLSNLILTGYVPNADLPLYQAAGDVLLMPYQPQVAASSGGDIGRYLSPMKLFEYLACGRPILSSDLAVLREVLHPGNAVLLPPDTPSAWALALTSLQRNPVYAATLAAQARLDARGYTWQARAERILRGIRL